MSFENHNKRISTRAEPIPDELQSLAQIFDSSYASDEKVYREDFPITFSMSRLLVEGFFADYIQLCGYSCVYHPICCCVKVSL